MKVLALALVATLSLTACGAGSSMRGDLSDQAHAVAVYYADATLSAGTIESCRARNEAEYRLMQSKPACVNVRAAEQRRRNEASARYDEESNRAMEKVIHERKAARATRAATFAAG